MRAREWAASILISPGAAILALSFILPAAEGCRNSVYYPYEFPEFYFPYFFGALCIIGGINLARNKVTKRFALLFALASGAGGGAWGVWLHSHVPEEPSTQDSLIFAFLMLTWWLGALFFFQVKKLAHPSHKVSRIIWSGAIWCITFFTIFLVEGSLYGLKLSFAASIALLAGGLIAEFYPRSNQND